MRSNQEPEELELFILFKQLNGGDRDMLSSNIDIEKIQENFKNQFEKEGKIILDFKNIRAISPSFAYKCFGKMYETKPQLEKLLNNIEVINDGKNFYSKIKKAIERRLMVLS